MAITAAAIFLNFGNWFVILYFIRPAASQDFSNSQV